jgi:hypothetical protein
LVTTISLIENAEPSDDAGALAADAFDWQASMGAADVFALIASGSQSESEQESFPYIICEHHEDWITVRGPEDVELVSAKHREVSTGPYSTIRSLLNAGGVRHLFTRWIRFDRKPRCRLVTNAGLRDGAKKLAQVAGLLADERRGTSIAANARDDIDKLVIDMADLLLNHPDGPPEGWVPEDDNADPPDTPTVAHLQQVRQFLSIVTFDVERPPRHLVGHAAPTLYASPALQHLSKPQAIQGTAWEAVLGLVRVRMRGRGELPEGGLTDVLLTWEDVTTSERRTRGLVARIVSVEDATTTISIAAQSPQGYARLAFKARITKLSVKMGDGGCPSTSVERAEMLRSDFAKRIRDFRSDLPGDSGRLAVLRRALMRAADSAQAIARESTPVDYGHKMWRELPSQISLITLEENPNTLDAELLLGGVCDLASRCRVWFGSRFDVDEAMRQLREGHA